MAARPGSTQSGYGDDHDQLDVVAGQQPADRPGQRRVAEHHHPLDVLGQRRGRQQPRGAQGRRSLPGVARRLGQHRDTGRRAQLGDAAADGRRRVPGDDHGLRSGGQLGRRVGRSDGGDHQLGGRRAGGEPGRVERLAELQVQLHRPGPTGPGPGGRCHQPGGLEPPGPRVRGRVGQRRVRPGVHAEQPVLVGGLVGPGVHQRPRPARGEQDQRAGTTRPPRAPRGAGWPRRCPRWSAPPPGGRTPWPGRGPGSPRCARPAGRAAAADRSGRRRAASYASGALRAPGREHQVASRPG